MNNNKFCALIASFFKNPVNGLLVVFLLGFSCFSVFSANAAQPTYSLDILSTTVNDFEVSINGTGEAAPYAGQLGQHNVQISWGDNTKSNTSVVNFVDPDGSNSGSKTFSGPWSNSHTYSTEGTYTITARLYHGNPQGAESSPDAFAVTTVTILPLPPKECILDIIKVVDVSTAGPSDVITYIFDVRNKGDLVCTGGGVKIEDDLDPRLELIEEFRSDNVDPGYEGEPLLSNGVLRWNAHELLPGEFGSVTWRAKVKDFQTCSPFDISNTVRATAREINWQWVYSNTVNTTVTKECPPQVTDITPPVSIFDNLRDHEAIVAELESLLLTGQSVDDMSGVASASLQLYQLADEEAMNEEGFFGSANDEVISPFEALSCDPLSEGAVEIETIQLSLTNADPLTVLWEHEWDISAKGVYCAIVHATDVAGNVENTAIAGPFAYNPVLVITPPPTPTPSPAPSPTPSSTPTLTSTGGGQLSNSIAPPQGGGIGGGQAVSQGEVLGATTACGPYLNSYIGYGKKNDSAEVIKLQQFLNEFQNANLSLTGVYEQDTMEQVHIFQANNWQEVLKPWVPYGLKSEKTSTGYVYKTTKRWINMLKCPSLSLPIPQLP